MYWQEENSAILPIVPDDIVDIVFSISCKVLPVDHAYSLSQAILLVLPWFVEEQGAGLHTIHVAESGNGWFRPNESGALLHPSRRTKFKLRVPKHRVEDAKKLVGEKLDIDGYIIEINSATVRSLSDHTTVFSRYVVTDGYDQEAEVLEEFARQLKDMGVKPKKMLCGTDTIIATPDKAVKTRSLMVADLSVEESVQLQMKGLGTHRWMGCGLFIPHKDIKEVSE